MKVLKRAFVLVLVLALAVSGIAIISATNRFEQDKTFKSGNNNGNEYVGQRPENAQIHTITLYVGGENGVDDFNPDDENSYGKTPDKPLATLAYAVKRTNRTYGLTSNNDNSKKFNNDDNAKPSSKYYDSVYLTCPECEEGKKNFYGEDFAFLDQETYDSDTLHQVEIVLVGDTYETEAIGRIAGGILTITSDVDATVHMGSNENLINSYFCLLSPRTSSPKTYQGYVELNLGTRDMKGTVTLDCTYFNPTGWRNNGTTGDTWGGFIRLGDESLESTIICNMYDGFTIKNIGYDEKTETLINRKGLNSSCNGGCVIQVDCGTFNMYGGTITQNNCEFILHVLNRNGAGAFMYGGEISMNMATVVATNYTANAKFIMYDGTIKNNVSSIEGAFRCSFNGSNGSPANNMIFYGGTIENNIGSDKSQIYIRKGNVYISDKVNFSKTLEFEALDGNNYSVDQMVVGASSPINMVSKVFFASDGSARAYGYCSDTGLVLKDGIIGGTATLEDVIVREGEYLFASRNNSCAADNWLKDTTVVEVNENMESAVYYLDTELAHSYNLSDHVPPTTTEEGYNEYICYDCGDTYRETLEKTDCDHDEYDIIETVEVTCTDSGYTLVRCKQCKLEFQIDIQTPQGHSIVKDSKDAACLEAGFYEERCINCDYYVRNDYPALGHDTNLIKTYPTNLYRCARCGETKETVFISYYQNLSKWATSEVASGSASHAKYTIEVDINTVFTIGKQLDGKTDVGHQSTNDDKTFFGWFTPQGDFFTEGQEVTLDSNLILYEAYGYEVDDPAQLKSKLSTGSYVRITKDMSFESKLDPGVSTDGTIALLDLNGHNITFEKYAANDVNKENNIYNDYAFNAQRVGLIVLGKGTIKHSAISDTYTCFFTRWHGYSSDGGQDNLRHTLWIGKGVTVETNVGLYYHDAASLSPMVRISGTVKAGYLCNFAKGSLEIYPDANITLANPSYMNNITTENEFKVNIYGGKITFPENMDPAYFLQNAKGEIYSNITYQISGGEFNIDIPENYVFDGYEVYQGWFSENYFVVPKCKNGTHEFVKGNSTATCTDEGYTPYTCSCGVVIKIANDEKLEHTLGKLVAIIYPNGFDKHGNKIYLCAVCKDEIEDIAYPIISALGYSVANDGTAIMGGYKLNNSALDEYEAINGTKLEYGVIFVNVSSEQASQIEFVDGVIKTDETVKAIQAQFNNIVTGDDGTKTRYDSFNFKVSGFVDPKDTKYADLEIVIAAYAMEREKSYNEEEKGKIKNVSFVQSPDTETGDEDTSIYNKNISIKDTGNTLKSVTLRRLYQKVSKTDASFNYDKVFGAGDITE